LTISVIAILLPAAFSFANSSSAQLSADDEQRDILSVSHGVCNAIMHNPPYFF
jgi:hypothetical protein